MSLGKIRTIVTISFELPTLWNEYSIEQKLSLSSCASLDVTLGIEIPAEFDIFTLSQWNDSENHSSESLETLTKTMKLVA